MLLSPPWQTQDTLTNIRSDICRDAEKWQLGRTTPPPQKKIKHSQYSLNIAKTSVLINYVKLPLPYIQHADRQTSQILD